MFPNETSTENELAGTVYIQVSIFFLNFPNFRGFVYALREILQKQDGCNSFISYQADEYQIPYLDLFSA